MIKIHLNFFVYTRSCFKIMEYPNGHSRGNIWRCRRAQRWSSKCCKLKAAGQWLSGAHSCQQSPWNSFHVFFSYSLSGSHFIYLWYARFLSHRWRNKASKALVFYLYSSTFFFFFNQRLDSCERVLWTCSFSLLI